MKTHWSDVNAKWENIHISFTSAAENRDIALIGRWLDRESLNIKEHATLIAEALIKAEEEKDKEMINFMSERVTTFFHKFFIKNFDEQKINITININSKQISSLFLGAAERGHTDVLIFMFNILPTQRLYMFTHEDWNKAFCTAAANGHKDVLNILLKKKDLCIQNNILLIDYYKAFLHAAENGHLNVLNLFFSKFSKEIRKNLIRLNNYEVFRLAAKNGHIDVLKLFFYILPNEQQEIIHSMNNESFCQAAKNGYIVVLNLLFSKLSNDKRKKMIRSNYYKAFQMAAMNGHIDVMNLLFSILPKVQWENMIQAKEYEAFQMAAMEGHIDIMNLLFSKLPEAQWEKMIKSQRYFAFGIAAKNGHIKVLNLLLEKYPLIWDEIMHSKKDVEGGIGDYLEAAMNGHIDVMNLLLFITPEKKWKKMLDVNNYYVFTILAELGYVNVLNLLFQNSSSSKWEEMICEIKYYVLYKTLEYGRVEVLKLFLEKAPSIWGEIHANIDCIFRAAIVKEHILILRFLLENNEEKGNFKSILNSMLESFIKRNDINKVYSLLRLFNEKDIGGESEEIYKKIITIIPPLNEVIQQFEKLEKHQLLYTVSSNFINECYKIREIIPFMRISKDPLNTFTVLPQEIIFEILSFISPAWNKLPKKLSLAFVNVLSDIASQEVFRVPYISYKGGESACEKWLEKQMSFCAKLLQNLRDPLSL